VPPPNEVPSEEMALEPTLKLPLPLMLLAVGAWPISSAAAGPANATAPPLMATASARADSTRATSVGRAGRPRSDRRCPEEESGDCICTPWLLRVTDRPVEYLGEPDLWVLGRIGWSRAAPATACAPAATQLGTGGSAYAFADSVSETARR
jgi:hypothetical protein